MKAIVYTQYGSPDVLKLLHFDHFETQMKESKQQNDVTNIG